MVVIERPRGGWDRNRRETDREAKREGVTRWIVLAAVVLFVLYAAGGGGFQYAIFVCWNGICTKAPEDQAHGQVADAASCRKLAAFANNWDGGKLTAALNYHAECRAWLPVVGWIAID
jgi:hypothetical protein